VLLDIRPTLRVSNVTFDLQQKKAWEQYGQLLAGTNVFTNFKETSISWQIEHSSFK
jgi:hypothetical protein